MSDTRKHKNYNSSRMMRLEDRRTGWIGESCWKQRGRKFIKRIEHRHNRRVGRLICAQFIN